MWGMILRDPLLDIASIEHGFFTRLGGVSSGIYQSLNCGFGSGDEPRRIAENRARCAAAIGVPSDRLVTTHQVHGVAVAEVTEPWAAGAAPPRADAMVTRLPGLALGILTADCAPILLADGEAGVIGAAHAGWKGARAGVGEAVVSAMVRLGGAAGRIVAVVGPAIGMASYEVGPEFRDAFLADDPALARFFETGSLGRPHFDLQGFVVSRLAALGLGAVERIEADTCADSTRFFSYRRGRLSGAPDYGRQLSAIALR
jgi:YfiH family protein